MFFGGKLRVKVLSQIVLFSTMIVSVSYGTEPVRKINNDDIISSQKRYPEAVINLPDNVVHLGQWVKADANGSSAEKGSRITSYEWGYLNSGNSELAYDWFSKKAEGKYEHRPMMVGEYYLTLKVTDSRGNGSLSTKAKITVLPNNPPKADIQYRIPDVGSIELDGGMSIDPDGDEIADWRWELPDGVVKHGRKIKYTPHKLASFRAGLIVKDKWGLEGQKEMDVILDTSPLNFKPTLLKGLLLRLKDKNIEGTGTTGMIVPVRLGFNEYMPLKIANASSFANPITVELKQGASEGGNNSWIRPLKAVINPGKEFDGVLEIKTILNVNHKVELVVKAGKNERRIPFTLQVQETYPIFGTQEHFNRTPPGPEVGLRDMAYLDELPCQIYRLPDVLCWFIQSKEGEKLNYDFGAADWSIKNITERGKTKVLPFLGYIPEWLRPLDVGLDEKLPYWKAHVKAVVQRYAKEVDYWEPYNEPPWAGVEDWNKNGSELMFKLMKSFYEEVKEADPTAKVLAPGWCLFSNSGKNIEQIIEMGGDKYVDIYNFHEYTQTPILGLGEMFDNMVRNGDGMRHVNLLHKYHIDKPLFITESGGGYNSINESEERIKAIQWLRTNLIWLNAGIKGILQYEYYDYPHDGHPPTFALVRSADHYKLPMFTATREIIKTMTGVKCIASEGKIPQTNVNYAIFQKEHETVVGIWSCVAYKVGLEIKVPKGKVLAIEDQCFNYSGNAFYSMKKFNVEGAAAASAYGIEIAPYQVRMISLIKRDAAAIPVKVQYKSSNSPIVYKVSKITDSKTIEVKISNQSPYELMVKTRFGQREDHYKLSPKQQTCISFKETDYGSVLELEYSYTENGVLQKGFESVPVRKNVQCLRLKNNSPVIDGAIGECAGVSPIELRDKNGLPICKAHFMWNEKGLYLSAEVNKEKYYQTNIGPEIFQGDSLQLAIDSGDNKNIGYDENDCEFGFTRLSNGNGYAFCWKAGTSGREGERKDINVAVRSAAGKTYYEVLIPWNAISGFIPAGGKKMGFDLLVNTNDGTGRDYSELTPGIGAGKCPYFYCDLVLTN